MKYCSGGRNLSLGLVWPYVVFFFLFGKWFTTHLDFLVNPEIAKRSKRLDYCSWCFLSVLFCSPPHLHLSAVSSVLLCPDFCILLCVSPLLVVPFLFSWKQWSSSRGKRETSLVTAESNLTSIYLTPWWWWLPLLWSRRLFLTHHDAIIDQDVCSMIPITIEEPVTSDQNARTGNGNWNIMAIPLLPSLFLACINFYSPHPLIMMFSRLTASDSNIIGQDNRIQAVSSSKRILIDSWRFLSKAWNILKLCLK